MCGIIPSIRVGWSRQEKRSDRQPGGLAGAFSGFNFFSISPELFRTNYFSEAICENTILSNGVFPC